MISPTKATAALWVVWLLAWIAAARATAKTVARQPVASRLAHTAPLLLGAALLFFVRPGRSALDQAIFTSKDWTQWLGVAATAFGLGYAGWARIHLGRFWSGAITLKADHALVRSGPYALTRHPIYTGLLLALIGTTVVRDTAGALAGLGFLVLGLLLKIRQEEQLLTAHFGPAYRVYQTEVPALIPLLRW